MTTETIATTPTKTKRVFGDTRENVYVTEIIVGFFLLLAVPPLFGGAIGGIFAILGFISLFVGIGNASYAVAKKSNWVLGILAFFAIFFIVAFLGGTLFPPQPTP